MKRGIDERGPIAAWLIRSREAFRLPGAERSWTVDDFLAALAAETGKAPARTTYARWESGAARPEPSSLRPIIAFYAARGVAGPESAPISSDPAPDLATALLGLTAELGAWRREREAMRAEIDELRATVALLVSAGPLAAGTPAPAAHAAPGR